MPEGWGPVDPATFALVATVALSAGLAVALVFPGAVVRHPRSVLAALALVTLASLAVLVRVDPPGLRLAIDPSTEPLLPVGDPGVGAYRLAVRDFGDDQVFVVAMECADGVFTGENLAALRRVSDAISRLDGVRRVQSLLRVTSFRYVPEEDWIEVRPFIEDVPDDPAALAELRERALADPVYRRNLISDDGRTAALNVTFRELSDREFIARGLDAHIREITASESSPGRRFYVSGRPHIKSQMYAAMTRDLRVLIPAAFGVVALVLAGVAGSLRGVLLPLATVSAAVAWTFGAIALLDRPLTVLSVLLAPTLLAIGSVYGVHVVNRYVEDAIPGRTPGQVALHCLANMRVPVLISGTTTCVGYAALLITDVPAVFEVGAFSVLGIGCVTLISLTGVPAALALLPVRGAVRFGPALRFGAWLDATLAASARLVSRRYGLVIACWAVATLVAAAAIPRIVIDTDYLSFFDADAPVRRDFEAIDRLLAGAVPLYIVLRAEQPGAFRDPDLLRRVEALETRIQALPGVRRINSFLDPLRALNRAVEGGRPEAERIPPTRAAVTELLFMFPKSDLLRFSTLDQSAMNLVVRTGAVGSAAMRRLQRAIEACIAEADLPSDVHAGVTGNSVLLSRAADGVARSQPATVGLAALAMFALLAVGLGSVGLGLVAMIPNVVPVLIFFGCLGLGAAPLSLPTSLIGSVTLGIAIDSTAHYLVRYRTERRAGATPELAVERTSRVVGRPVAITALMLVLGFASVAASDFATLRQFGLLSAFTMAVCCFADLLLLPSLLVRWRI